MRILVAEQVAQEGIELLRASHQVDERTGLTPEELRTILPDYDALIVRSQVQVDAEMIAAGTRLAVIGRAGVGVDNVDLDAATRAGIVVVNAPTGNTIAAAEHTLALLYGVARRIAAADASVRRGEWKRAQFTGLELRGRTLGIVGLGKIGQAIAVRARAMEMVVLGVDPYVTAEAAANHGVELVGVRRDARPCGRRHRPRPADPRDTRPHRARGDRPAQARVDRVERGPWRRRRRGRRRRGTAVRSPRRCGDRRLRTGAADRFAAARRTEHAADATPRGLDRRGPGRSSRRRSPRRSSTCSTAGALATRSTRRCSPRRRPGPSRRTCRSPRSSGRFFAQFSRGGVRTLTLEIAGELADYDATPLTAAVLRGLLEHSITERVNLVNAGALAKARGITVVERKTPDAGSFAALITLSGESGGRTTVVAGTVAGGEPRITRLDDYRLDMAPADNMLITRHQDRPGTVGRVGLMLGEADINISAMHLARTRPREDAFMILALDDDVPDGGVRGHPVARGRHATCG